jgi:phenol 2-monooxygenase
VLKSPYVEVRRRTAPISLHIIETELGNHRNDLHPIHVGITAIPEPEKDGTLGGGATLEGTKETIQARYLLGCDGAHSWVRKQLGLKLEGASRDVSWGVLDAFPITDFRKCSIPWPLSK